MTSPIRVLIIDDNETDRRVCRRFLESSKEAAFSIDDAETAAKGLKLLAEKKFDCLILDYQLPDQNGLKVLDQIRAYKVATIIITGQPEPNLVNEAYKRGALRYISKDTMTSMDLCEAVIAVCGEN